MQTQQESNSTTRFIERFKSSFARWYYPDELTVFGLALIVGALTGLGAVIFIWLLEQIGLLVQQATDRFGAVGLLVVMALAGMIVGFIIDRWAHEAKGHGVPEVMEAIALRGGRIRPRVAAMKVLASSITIGAGGSAGREGPIVQVGSALGSTLGQWTHLSDQRTRTLVACGAAAGIAATFNAPIAGSIFALEVILGRLAVRNFGAIVLSAVSASIVSRIWLGDQPAFQVPSYTMNHLGELPIYAVLSVLAAIMAVLFIRILYATEGLADRWSLPLPWKTAVGMLLTGVVALALPGREVLGPGLHLIGETIAEDFNLAVGFMLLLLVGKLVATTTTLGFGNSGGVFAPSLFMGAVLGGMVGSAAQNLWPSLDIHPGAYAIVGMAAMFAGSARAPITAILIVFEMSGDYKLILPLMLSTVLTTLLAEFIFAPSIYTFKLKLKGINWQGGRDKDILESVAVAEVMSRGVLEPVSSATTLETLADIFANSHHNGLAVLDEKEQLWGIVTISDVERALTADMPLTTPVSEIGATWPRLKVAFPDETIGQALARLSSHGLGRLPVVARENPYQLLGMIRREDIVRAYDLALARRDEIQDRTERMQALQQQDDTEYVEIFLNDGDTVVGKSLMEIAPELPNDCVLVSVERERRVIIPHGNTIFRSGDHITVYTRRQTAASVFNCFHQA